MTLSRKRKLVTSRWTLRAKIPVWMIGAGDARQVEPQPIERMNVVFLSDFKEVPSLVVLCLRNHSSDWVSPTLSEIEKKPDTVRA